MTYLNLERMDEIEPQAFQSQEPFPWVNPAGLLTEGGYQQLLETLPEVGLFQNSFGTARAFGQDCHDRFNLEYRPGLEVSEPWLDFIEELTGQRYRHFLKRLFGRGSFRLRFHWHYAPSGCSVSPHCDSRQKVGSHIFYFNSSRDWDPAWGGATVVLDDGGRHNARSSPAFEDFDSTVSATFLDNRSFIFRRTAHSWHGVPELHCPADAMRKIFIVVVDGWRLHEQIRSRRQRPNVARF